MASSQMGMWQGSLEVFCGAVLNKKSSLPRKKRGLDLRNPSTVASPSSIIAFNTFSYPLLTRTYTLCPRCFSFKVLHPRATFWPIAKFFDVCDAVNRSGNGSVKVEFIQIRVMRTQKQRQSQTCSSSSFETKRPETS